MLFDSFRFITYVLRHMMQKMNIQIDSNPAHDILVEFADFEKPPQRPALDFLGPAITSLLFDLAHNLKTPFEESVALLTHHLQFDKQPSLINTTLGVTGAAVGFVPWTIGTGLTQYAALGRRGVY